jgi:hypothetical protein
MRELQAKNTICELIDGFFKGGHEKRELVSGRFSDRGAKRGLIRNPPLRLACPASLRRFCDPMRQLRAQQQPESLAQPGLRVSLSECGKTYVLPLARLALMTHVNRVGMFRNIVGALVQRFGRMVDHGQVANRNIADKQVHEGRLVVILALELARRLGTVVWYEI